MYLLLFLFGDIKTIFISQVLFGRIYTVALYPEFYSEGYILSRYIPSFVQGDIYCRAISQVLFRRIYIVTLYPFLWKSGYIQWDEIKKHGSVLLNAAVFIVEVYNFECGSLILFHFLGTESHCIQMHLLDHRHQTIRTGGREVFFQSDLLDEI